MGLMHLRLGGTGAGTGNKPSTDVTVCDCVVDDARQFMIAIVRSSDLELPWQRRTYLIGLDLLSPATTVGSLPQILQPMMEPVAVAAGPDRQLLVAAVNGGVYFINPRRPDDNPVLVTRHDKPPFQIKCSSDGHWLVTVEFEQLCVWDLPSRELKWRREGGDVCSAAFVPNADVIVCGMADGGVAELSLETGDELRRINRHQSPVRNLSVSPQGNCVASYCESEEIRVTNRLTGASIWQYRAGRHGLPTIQFSRDGRRLVTVDFVEGDWAVRVWNLENQKCLCDFRGLGGAVLGAEFLSDEELLTWGTDGKVCRWSLATGLLVQTISLDLRGDAGT
jgi:WD40 repeat protein